MELSTILATLATGSLSCVAAARFRGALPLVVVGLPAPAAEDGREPVVVPGPCDRGSSTSAIVERVGDAFAAGLSCESGISVSLSAAIAVLFRAGARFLTGFLAGGDEAAGRVGSTAGGWAGVTFTDSINLSGEAMAGADVFGSFALAAGNGSSRLGGIHELVSSRLAS